MSLKARYEAAKQRLLDDEDICRANRKLFARFFEYEEYKLKRKNGIAQLDDNSYKTLLAYVTRLRTVNRWFTNKPWEKLAKQDIKRVYDDLEDGKITNHPPGPKKWLPHGFWRSSHGPGASEISPEKHLRDCPSSAMLVFEYHKETCHGNDLYELLCPSEVGGEVLWTLRVRGHACARTCSAATGT